MRKVEMSLLAQNTKFATTLFCLHGILGKVEAAPEEK